MDISTLNQYFDTVEQEVREQNPRPIQPTLTPVEYVTVIDDEGVVRHELAE